MAIKTAKELAAACMEVAKNYKTLYIMGCFGAPMTAKNKSRYTKNHSYNKQDFRVEAINAASTNTFGFDCVCLIKGLLWGWNGDTAKVYGGAGYAINGVPDIDAGEMIKVCKDVSTDFSKILVGEVVYMPGHIGVYIGDGLAVECTPIWKDGVQITAVANIGCKEGYNAREWEKHGKLPYVTYEEEKPKVTYQVYAGGKWLPEVTGYNELNTDGYAGVFGKPISCIRVKLPDATAVDVWLHNKVQPKSTGGEQIDCIAMRAESCQLRYRVHIVGGHWLPWVTGFDLADSANGYAGIYGKPIDAVQIDVVEKE
jgi:hypothetical protein